MSAWPPASLKGRGAREIAQWEYKGYTVFVQSASASYPDPTTATMFVSDGSGGLTAGDLYFINGGRDNQYI